MNPDRPDRPEEQAPTAAEDWRSAAAAEGAAEAPTGQPGSDLAQRLADVEATAAELRDQYLRAVAELENVRRRAQEDVAKAHKYGIEGFAESLLPVKDSLEMALKADTPTVDNLKEGVDATLRLLASAFEKNRLLEIDPQGERFDPNRHQAISTVPAAATQPPIAPNHVAHVLQKGYLIGDRVLRPALVTVVQG
ncbi:MAG TPA: nucleotide exchange factor GrpE [Zeimonas sp.]|nr:nucleotide exchange factor GrpE [Zeimonas sp.]